jgi:hypothetical protein
VRWPRPRFEQAVNLARGRLERAEQKKVRMETYGKDKIVNELKGEVARAVAEEQTAKATYDQLKAAVVKLCW